MYISGYDSVSSSTSRVGLFSAEESQKMRSTMHQSQTMNILGGMPQSNAYVLDESLMNAIYDAKAVTPTVLNSYVDKVEETYGPGSEQESEPGSDTKVDSEEKRYLSPQEEITERLAEEEAKAEVETEVSDSVVIEQAEEGVNPFLE
ncbi:MAG: hypothetical protein OCD01_16220 [Fibrobacterales bacterium]